MKSIVLVISFVMVNILTAKSHACDPRMPGFQFAQIYWQNELRAQNLGSGYSKRIGDLYYNQSKYVGKSGNDNVYEVDLEIGKSTEDIFAKQTVTVTMNSTTCEIRSVASKSVSKQ